MTHAATWSTAGLPRGRAMEAWTRKVPELHPAWAMSFPDTDRFDVAVRYRRLDRLTIADFTSGRFTGQRPAAGPWTGEQALVGVLMNLSGRLRCRYASGREIALGPGDLLVWDSELAHSFDVVEPHRELYLLLPRERAPHGLVTAAARAGGAIPAGAGAGLAAIAAEQLRATTRELDHLSDAALAIACQTFFDTLDCALTPASEPASRPARASLLVKVRHYIEDNLDDPGLCASSIAAAQGISLRTLHMAFAGTGSTVGRWVRDRRLKACYRELSRAGGTDTVTDVAFRWGFNDAAHFSRTFKLAFGVTPSSVLARGREATHETLSISSPGALGS
jgi:AraC-like DNA-binding protein